MEYYKYVGSGAGVVGLPNVVSRAEAIERGVEHILNAAIKNSNYEKMGGAKKTKNRKKVKQGQEVPEDYDGSDIRQLMIDEKKE